MKRLGLVILCLAGCSNDNQADARIATPPIDAGPGAPDAGAPDANLVVARGSYLVNALSACGDCHTPRLSTGAPDPNNFLAGNDCFIDVMPTVDGMGCLHSANLTNDDTGLKKLTDQQIKDAFQTGVLPDSTILNSVMPYWMFNSYTADDANAIVAYLRTVKGVSHTVAPNEIPWTTPVQAQPMQDTDVPPAAAAVAGTTIDSSTRGRYLASKICIDCHTPDGVQGSAMPKDFTRAFGGDVDFNLGPPFNDVYSANITPDPTNGIAGWTVDNIKTVLATGKDDKGAQLCPPMPFGPMGAFGHLTDADATDIANYILNVPAVDQARPSECTIPTP
jgi:mono/diheme cytochrome c family protein